MAFTQEQYDAISAAIAEGVTTVSQNGRQIAYRNLSDMIKVRNLMAEELGITSGAGNRRSRRYVQFSRD